MEILNKEEGSPISSSNGSNNINNRNRVNNVLQDGTNLEETIMIHENTSQPKGLGIIRQQSTKIMQDDNISLTRQPSADIFNQRVNDNERYYNYDNQSMTGIPLFRQSSMISSTVINGNPSLVPN